MSGHGDKLSRKQEQAIVALIAQPTIPAAAGVAGVSDATLWRWLQRPDFLRAYRDARRQVVEQSLGEVQSATSEAVRTLRAVMSDDSAPPASRVAAARAVLDTALRAVELMDLETRIADLETAAMLDTDGRLP
jgi:hypothetical protein